jgi:hypothetical protein
LTTVFHIEIRWLSDVGSFVYSYSLTQAKGRVGLLG